MSIYILSELEEQSVNFTDEISAWYERIMERRGRAEAPV